MNFRLSINARVARDLEAVLAFYEMESGANLADAFYEDLMSLINQVHENPKHFPFSMDDRRRANLDRFPDHFLYRIKSGCIRILVLQHHQRNPNFGKSRQ